MERKRETWLVGTESWCFSVVEMKGVCISAFTRSAALCFSFLGHLYSCQAGTPGMGGGEGEESSCEASLASLEVFPCLDFNSCFLIAGNERIYEGLRDVHYSSSMNVLLI